MKKLGLDDADNPHRTMIIFILSMWYMDFPALKTHTANIDDKIYVLLVQIQ